MDVGKILQKWFGFASFRGRQREVIDHVLAGRHALVIMPTGSGKSLCYQIPALVHAERNVKARDRAGLTLVISPLIALMKDQVDSLAARGIDATFINSSLRRDERIARYAAVSRGEYALLYVTPERFRKPEFVEIMARRRIDLLAVDEAHCISEWGHDFRPDYTRLAEFRQLLEHPTTIALTATATPDVQRDIVRQLGLTDDDVTMFHEGIDRPNLNLDVVEVWGDDEKLDHIAEIASRDDLAAGSGIVYFTLIRTLSEFSERLRERGVAHVCYHGDVPRQLRRDIQDAFMTGGVPLVLATNAFGMGVDKEDIRFVIHADVPGSMEAYYQEIGRAGRDGQPAQCTLLYDQHDLATQMEFIRWSNPDAELYRRIYDLLRDESEQIESFGLEWLKEKLHAKKARHDFRVETALSMLDRHGITEGEISPFTLRVVADLPPQLADSDRLAEKERRDQQKLYALVQYVQCEGNRTAFIHDYFGLPFEGDD